MAEKLRIERNLGVPDVDVNPVLNIFLMTYAWTFCSGFCILPKAGYARNPKKSTTRGAWLATDLSRQKRDYTDFTDIGGECNPS